MDCRDHMNLAVTPPDASNSQWRMAWFDPNNHNQQWRQDIEGRLINRGNGMAWKWDYYVNTFVDVNTDFSWSFNTCTRSTQEYSSSPIAQKLQVVHENRCLNAADQFSFSGSELMLWDCNTINPVNGCFKFSSQSF